MRILFVNEKLGWFGGVEQNVSDTAEGLRELGHECFLAWGEKTERDPDRYAGLFAGTSPCRDLGATEGKTISALADEWQADVIYFHKIARLPERSELGNGRPLVRMVHDHDLCCPRRHKYFVHNAHVCHHPAGWRCWLDLAWLERDRSSALGFAVRGLGEHKAERDRNHAIDVCLVGSRFMKSELEMNGFPSEKVSILAPVVRRTSRPPTPMGDTPKILFVGQLIRGKGVDLLLEALAKLDKPFEATIVGEGNARPALEAHADALGLGDRVRFTGWVANNAIDEYYAQARVLAVPARWPEPFGMIGLEAMHHARPIVGFATGGIPDWLIDGENGCLIEERDTTEFAAALEKLITDKTLAEKMGLNGWELVRDRFSFEKYLERLVEFLQEAAR